MHKGGFVTRKKKKLQKKESSPKRSQTSLFPLRGKFQANSLNLSPRKVENEETNSNRVKEEEKKR